MKNTIVEWLSSVTPDVTKESMRNILNPIGNKMASVMLTTAGLAIKAGGSALVKNGTACYGAANGGLFTIAANTDMPALSGTVVNATFNVFVFAQDAAGTRTTTMGTAGATLKAVKLPEFAEKVCLIGMVIINPTGTGNFVGGTTALDDVTVVPTAAYVNFIGASDLNILLG